jgi:hypothetical protein
MTPLANVLQPLIDFSEGIKAELDELLEKAGPKK